MTQVTIHLYNKCNDMRATTIGAIEGQRSIPAQDSDDEIGGRAGVKDEVLESQILHRRTSLLNWPCCGLGDACACVDFAGCYFRQALCIE